MLTYTYIHLPNFSKKNSVNQTSLCKDIQIWKGNAFLSSIVIFITLKVIITMKMTFSKHCGGVWQIKQQWRTYPLNFHVMNENGILKLTVNLWKPVEIPVRIPRNFQCKETRMNNRVDCCQMWKLVETTCEVSSKFQMQGMQVESSSWLSPGVET